MRAALLAAAIFLAGAATALAAPPRALFVTLIQDPPVLESREAIEKLVEFSAANGVATLYVQVYRGNQAWFPSKTADRAPYDACVAAVGEDPLALLIEKAHERKIQVHAWMNLLSISLNEEAPLLKAYGPEILTRDASPKAALADYKIDNQYFLEPGDPRVRQALLNVVEEVVSAYPALDGVQFDYIRYPDVHPVYGHGPANEERYKKATNHEEADDSAESWKEWKREQVTSLLKELRQRAKSVRPRIQVSTTGLMPYARAKLEASQDWKLWLDRGWADFVTLMAYSTDPEEFKKLVGNGQYVLKNLRKTNVAVGAYAMTGDPRGFREEFELAETSGARETAILHYGSLLENPKLAQALENEPPRAGEDD